MKTKIYYATINVLFSVLIGFFLGILFIISILLSDCDVLDNDDVEETNSLIDYTLSNKHPIMKLIQMCPSISNYLKNW